MPTTRRSSRGRHKVTRDAAVAHRHRLEPGTRPVERVADPAVADPAAVAPATPLAERRDRAALRPAPSRRQQHHLGTRLAKVAVAAGLTVGVAGYAVAAGPAQIAAAPEVVAARQAERVAAQEARMNRAEVVEAAATAAASVEAVKAAAAAATVPADQLAELDAALAEVDKLLAETDDATGDANADDAGVSTDGVTHAADDATTDDATEAPGADADGGTPTDAGATGSTGATTGTTTDTAPTAEAPGAADPDAPAANGATTGTTTAPVIEVPEVDGHVDAATTALHVALQRLADKVALVEQTTAANLAAAEAAAAEAKAAAEAAALKEAQRTSLDAYANGRIPESALCNLSFAPDQELRCDAAEAIEALDAAYLARFGVHLDVGDSYRSYAGQVACRRTKGYLCARPGTSNHGTGTAVDLAGGVQSFGSPQYRWMQENAGTYGWAHPSWAERGGSKPEAWHWEYVG